MKGKSFPGNIAGFVRSDFISNIIRTIAVDTQDRFTYALSP